jgi:DDE_Tnp_1-associated
MRSKKAKKKGQERETKDLFSGRIEFYPKTKPSRKKRRMQYSESIVNCRKGTDQDQLRPADGQATFESVKDPRRKQGQRYSLRSILLLALAAILSNHVSELAIAQWGAAQSEEVKKA